MKRIGDIVEQIRGVSYKPEDLHKNLNENSVVLLRANNIKDGELNFDDVVYVDRKKVSDKQYLKAGDILICASSGSKELVGKAAYVNKELDVTFGAFCKVVRPKIECTKYVGHFFDSPNYRRKISNASAGANINNIRTEDIDSLDIPFPPLEKQQEIVARLDKVTDLIALRKQQLSKLDELVKARFVELFGDPVVNPKSWETAPLSALIINANNGMARRGKDADGSIVLRLVELQNGFIDYSAPNRICLNETEKKRYELVDNDFLFARVNGNPDYVGRCAVFKSIDEPVFHNDHIIRVHFDEAKINGCFMSVLLNSDYGKRQMREQIKTSAGQYTISQDGIGAIIAILPPLELQNQFAAFVKQTDKSKLAIQKSLDQLETLKKALMQEYFG